jgi:ParB family chromosome partitioning protein
MNIQFIPLDRIDRGDRLRAVDEDYARVIAASMQADGARTPIEVRAADADGMHKLIAGGHRCRAAEIAGLTELPAVVMDVGALDARRLEIEENLCRHDLSELDRSTFLANWKEIYEALNKQTRHGGARRKHQVAKNGDLMNIERFTAIASERLGMSERTIQRATARFQKIAGDVRARISGTWLSEHGAELDLLARMRPEVQRKVIHLMEERGATSLKPLRDQVMGIRAPVLDPDVVQYEALMKLWRKTSAKARRRFEAELAKDHQFDIDGQPTNKSRENGDA